MSRVIAKKFSAVPLGLLTDHRCSGNAVRLWAYMNSRPEGWLYSSPQLTAAIGIGDSSFKAAKKQLIDCGWVKAIRIKKPDGTFGGFDYEMMLEPEVGNPSVGNPPVDDPSVGNHPVYIEGGKLEGIKKERDNYLDHAFDRFWNAYDKKIAKGGAKRAWRAAVKKEDPEVIIKHAHHHRDLAKKAGVEIQFRPHPATWLNQERWADEHLSQVGEIDTGEGW